ncbi:helix-turn-helix domain-containing protein [Saccharopolyspora sp. WRP15-2]|uniref:Helix-turn-helix domain-containing protein n=1 Tax=Saccharopolyspora oryzae TaxID=2997343 RepID=A0ABT4UWV2_9PSEU|nr:helix-turn-helix domain-containing protein [Saccharopolyspora oryzae]MDA3625562.1 helix-turn-helix domain-containing protein [Saccharopolyspora oryzae]
MSGSDLQRMVDALAEEIGRSVAINDPSVHLKCASRHFGDEDEVRVHAVLQREGGSAAIGHMLSQGITEWTGPGVIPARADLHMRARLCRPIRCRGELLGLLMVIDPESLTEADIGAIEDSAAAMAALLYRDFVAEDEQRVAREGAVLELLCGTAERRTAAQRALGGQGWLRGGHHATVSVAEVVAPGKEKAQVEVALRVALEAVSRNRFAEFALAVDGNRGFLLQSAPAPKEHLRDQGAMVAKQVRDALGGSARCVVGIGTTAGGLAEAWISREQASTAARSARTLPDAADVVFWEELGVYATLLQIPDDRLTPRLLPAALNELIANDPHGRLVRTLAVYLDNAGSGPDAAAALHIHRTSLYYRLHQIEQITGLSLANGDNRLALHLGVRMMALLDDPS